MTTTNYQHIAIVEWTEAGKNIYLKKPWYAQDLEDALAVMRKRYPDKTICRVFTKMNLKEHITKTYKIAEAKMFGIASRGPGRLTEYEKTCYDLCKAYAQMSDDQIYVEDELFSHWGKFETASGIDEVRQECLMYWINHNVIPYCTRHGKICRELTEAEIAKVFEEEKFWPRGFDCAKERREKLPKIIKSAKHNLFICKDDVLYADKEFFDNVNDSRVEGLRHSHPIIETVAA